MDLYTSAIREGGAVAKGDIVAIDFGDDHGALVVSAGEFRRARRMAETVAASGIRPKDVRQFADSFAIRIARPGAAFPTRGEPGALLQLARGMQAAGLEYNSWHLPREVKQALRQRAQGAGARVMKSYA